MEKLTKKQLKHLRKLAGKAYERELSARLEELREKFDLWVSGEINAWQISDLIHEFHDGDSRELYKFYNYGKDYAFQVARAVRYGYLSMNDIEASCRGHVQYFINNIVHEDIE